MAAREFVANLLSVGALRRLLERLGDGLLIVNYHRVTEPASSCFDDALVSATREAFEAQIRTFKESFDIVGPGDLERIRGARGRHLQITFDDGYRDNYEVAYPVLARHGVPATFFLATGFIDEPRVPWWDELSWMIRRSRRDALPPGRWLPAPVPLVGPLARRETLRRLKAIYSRTPLEEQAALLEWLGEVTGAGRCDARDGGDLWMSWDMIREMRRGGMTFGAHTVRHVELSRLPREAQAEEISTSMRRVEQETGAPVTVFAYPYGWPASFNDDTRGCLRAAGVAFAYTFYGGHQAPGAWDPYALRRVAVEPGLSRAEISAMGALPRWFAREWDAPGEGVASERMAG